MTRPPIRLINVKSIVFLLTSVDAPLRSARSLVAVSLSVNHGSMLIAITAIAKKPRNPKTTIGIRQPRDRHSQRKDRRQETYTGERKTILPAHFWSEQREELPVHGVDRVRSEQHAKHGDAEDAWPSSGRFHELPCGCLALYLSTEIPV